MKTLEQHYEYLGLEVNTCANCGWSIWYKSTKSGQCCKDRDPGTLDDKSQVCDQWKPEPPALEGGLWIGPTEESK